MSTNIELLLDTLKQSQSDSEQFQIRQELCGLGVPARLCGIKAALDIQEPMRALGAIGDLTNGMQIPDSEPIYEPVLVLLSESPREEAWWYLCELAYLFEPNVSRETLKNALVKIWKKAKDEQRENIEHTLRHRGFKDELQALKATADQLSPAEFAEFKPSARLGSAIMGHGRIPTLLTISVVIWFAAWIVVAVLYFTSVMTFPDPATKEKSGWVLLVSFAVLTVWLTVTYSRLRRRFG